MAKTLWQISGADFEPKNFGNMLQNEIMIFKISILLFCNVNNKKNDFDMLLQEKDIAIDLKDASSMTAELLQKKVITNMKICWPVKQNMHVSRTHSTWVLDLLNVAIDKAKGGQMLNWLWAY